MEEWQFLPKEEGNSQPLNVVAMQVSSDLSEVLGVRRELVLDIRRGDEQIFPPVFGSLRRDTAWIEAELNQIEDLPEPRLYRAFFTVTDEDSIRVLAKIARAAAADRGVTTPLPNIKP